MKIAYKYHDGKRKHILHASVSFHGTLLGSGGMTNVLERHFKFLTIPGIKSFELNSLESVRALVITWDHLIDDSPGSLCNYSGMDKRMLGSLACRRWRGFDARP